MLRASFLPEAEPSSMRAPTFAGGSIDRAALRRAEAAALLRRPEARVLPLWRGKPLTADGPPPALAWLAADDPRLGGAVEPPLFLGLDPAGAPRFALDVSHLEGPAPAPGAAFLDSVALEFEPGRRFVELRALMAELAPDDAGDAATAKGVVEWHRSHPHCARCGARTVAEEGGWRRGCPACGAQHFPRTDPVVIMLVLDGDRALLGRQASWPEGMVSLLAGFMEPGETVEEAVRRETFEEAGVRVGRVGYLCSQPWPFPSSLMIGCVAEALTTEIALDPAELEAASWVERAAVADALAGRPAPFKAARRGAVARAMLEAWVAGETGAFAWAQSPPRNGEAG
jgi:NAD+ diphosphatase